MSIDPAADPHNIPVYCGHTWLGPSPCTRGQTHRCTLIPHESGDYPGHHRCGCGVTRDEQQVDLMGALRASLERARAARVSRPRKDTR